MTGDFDEARRLIAEANAILDELGRLHSRVSHHEAQVELLAGDPRRGRSAAAGATCERLEAMGEQALLATTAAMLAQARLRAGPLRRGGGAERVGERSAAAEDLLDAGDLARRAGAACSPAGAATRRPRRSRARPSRSSSPATR